MSSKGEWVRVPREPTAEMVRAGRVRINLQMGNQGMSGHLSVVEVMDCWKSMLRAAESSPPLLKHESGGSDAAEPSEPSEGLLVSIALRLDHGLFMRNEFLGETEEQHERRIDMALRDARKAWEEVTGHGFYSTERECMYLSMLESRQVTPRHLFQIAKPGKEEAPQ